MTRHSLVARMLSKASLHAAILISGLPGVVLSQPPQPQAAPEVYALIVGVTDYGVPGEKATKAAEGAKQFASFVERTYGKDAIKHLLLDHKATKANVEQALRKIRRVAPGSLVIIYFSGHGSRVQYDACKVLFLRLHGSSATEVEEKSIEAHELLDCLSYTKYTNAMIFLDCCYAGGDQLDIVPESRLNTSGVRAFLMSACSKQETATGDVFTKALLDVWKSEPADNGGCMRLDDFEDRVKKNVFSADKGYMSPGVTFKTRIVRCVAHLKEPSTFLSFVFPRGCNAGLSFTFDDKLVETGFQCAADYTFVSQVSAEKPVNVTIQAPNKVLIAGLTIDPRKYSPRRVIVIEVSVPDKYALPKEGVSAFSAKSYETLANLVAAYGDPPQDFYVKAAQFAREANPLEDTQWLLAQAHSHEPTNEIYGLAAHHTPLSQQTLAKYADNPRLGWNVIESLELCGANRAASELAVAMAEKIGSDRPGTLRGDLLVRAIGNAKCDQSEFAREVGSKARGLLMAGQVGDHQKLAVDAIDKSDADAVARVWSAMPKDHPSWLAWEAHSSKSEKDKVVKFVTQVSGSNERLTKMLSALTFDQLKRAERLDYFSGESEFIFLVYDDKIEVSRKGTLPSSAYPIYVGKTDGASKITFKASSLDEWKAFQIAKPGFQTKMESDLCWLKPFDEPAGIAGTDSIIRFTVKGGQKCIATLPTAAKYHTSKPGFAVRYEGKTVFVDMAGENQTEKLYGYSEEVMTSFGSLKLSFKNKDVAEKYNKAPDFQRFWEESVKD